MTDQEMLQQVQERIAEEQQGQPSSDGPKLDKHGLPIPKPDFVERCLYANELGDGLLFAYLFKGRHAYVGQADEWIWWSGHHWSVDLIEKGHRARAGLEARPTSDGDYEIYGQERWPQRDQARLMGWLRRFGSGSGKRCTTMQKAHKGRHHAGTQRQGKRHGPRL